MSRNRLQIEERWLMMAMLKESYCGGVASSGRWQSWRLVPGLRPEFAPHRWECGYFYYTCCRPQMTNKVLSKKRQIHSVSRHFSFFMDPNSCYLKIYFWNRKSTKSSKIHHVFFHFQRKNHGDFAPWDRWDERPVGLSSLWPELEALVQVVTQVPLCSLLRL